MPHLVADDTPSGESCEAATRVDQVPTTTLGGLQKECIVMQSFEKLQQAEKLVRQVNEGFFVVVEGKRDVVALRNIGVACPIVKATGKPESVVRKIVEQCGQRKPTILFDFDETGNERKERLTELLIASGCPPVELRGKFRAVFGLRFFEDADNKLEEIHRKNEGEHIWVKLT